MSPQWNSQYFLALPFACSEGHWVCMKGMERSSRAQLGLGLDRPGFKVWACHYLPASAGRPTSSVSQFLASVSRDKLYLLFISQDCLRIKMGHSV